MSYQKSNARQAFWLLGGFALILSVLISAFHISIQSLEVVNQQLSQAIQRSHIETNLLLTMRDAVRKRLLTTVQSLYQQDPFLLENGWEKTVYEAANFLGAKRKLYALGSLSKQSNVWQQQQPLLEQSWVLLNRILDSAREEDYQDAYAQLARAYQINHAIVVSIDSLLDATRHHAEKNIQFARLDYERTKQQVNFFSLLSGLLCLAIILFIVMRIRAQEQALNDVVEELKLANENLEQRILERTSELMDSRDEALEASQAKSQFLANMSHELRTPLNAVIGYSELLGEEALESGFEIHHADLDKITNAGQYLLHLVNNVLDISKIEAGKMKINLQQFGLQLVVENSITTLSTLFQKKQNKVSLEYDDSIKSIYADPLWIQQVLTNLLNNANKFSENGQICLELKAFEKEGIAWFYCKIKDTGIGISIKQQKRLFQAFTQVDNSHTRRYDGTGLGLVISQRYCQLMGGYIDVKSSLGEGSCFTINLPQVVTHKSPDIQEKKQ